MPGRPNANLGAYGLSRVAYMTDLAEAGFRLRPEHEKEIWIQDSRVKKGPIQTKGTADLVTRVDPWIGAVEIKNEHDTLAITDDRIAKAADLLIATTESLDRLTCRFEWTTNPSIDAGVGLDSTRKATPEARWRANIEKVKFTPLPGHRQDIWIRDMCVKQGPDPDQRHSRTHHLDRDLEIVNEHHTLAIADDQIANPRTFSSRPWNPWATRQLRAQRAPAFRAAAFNPNAPATARSRTGSGSAAKVANNRTPVPAA